jgi:hypothetical protein
VAYHGGAGPAGELDSSVAYSARTSGDEHVAPSEGARAEGRGAVGAHGEAAMRRESRDTETGAQIERGFIRQRHSLALGECNQLLRRPLRPLPRGLPNPDSLADAAAVDAGADVDDRAGTVLVGHHRREGSGLAGGAAAAGLPVGRIHP